MSPFIADSPQANLSAFYENVIKDETNIPTLRRSYSNVVPVFDLDEENYRLKREIHFLVEAEDNYYVGMFAPLGIYCYGNSPMEVTDNLKKDILDIYDHLLILPNAKLGKILKQNKNYLMKTVEKMNG